ncbi:hypothetical protein JCM1841_003202 [Sporobolomyces salmonicolor]
MASYMYNHPQVPPQLRDVYGRPMPTAPAPRPYLPPSQVRPAMSPRQASSPTFHSHGSSPHDPYRPPDLYPRPPAQHDSRRAARPPPASPSLSEHDPERIKCSSCSAWVHLDDLGDHVCAPAPAPAKRERCDEGAGRILGDLRVDIQAAAESRGPQAFGANLSARSPMFSGHLEATPPHTPGTPGSSASRPSSPSGLSAHSNSSASSATSHSKMPFFERYNKLVGSSGGGGGNMAGVGVSTTSMSRSGTLDSLNVAAKGGMSPPTSSPGFIPYTASRSPSPNAAAFPTSMSVPNLTLHPQASVSSPSSYRKDSLPLPTPLRQASPNPSQSSFRSAGSQSRENSHDSYRPHQRQETLDSSIPSGSPPRSRKISINDRGVAPPPPSAPSTAPQESARPSSRSSSHSSGSHYLAYDRRETIKPSQSTPADLSAYTSSRPPQSAHRPSGSSGSASALDTCLEDLRIMATGDEDEDDGGAQAMLDEFFATGRSPTREPAYGPFPDDEEDVTATPRPTKLPTSRSTPAGLARGLTAMAPLPTSGSSPNLMASSHSKLAAISGSSKRDSTCTTCRKRLGRDAGDVQRAGDGQVFCRACYAERYLPKCRKCKKAIEGGAVTSSDGKVTGKYHPACFSCFTCSKSFPTGDFYVYDGKPYCQYDYHALNGSLCTNKMCGGPIEGPCVSLVGEENGGGGRYHPSCFNCTTCRTPLLEHHFVVDGLPYCELHSAGPASSPRSQARAAGGAGQQTSRAKKRQTIITRR